MNFLLLSGQRDAENCRKAFTLTSTLTLKGKAMSNYIQIEAHEIRKGDILYGSPVNKVWTDNAIVVVMTNAGKQEFFYYEPVEVERNN